uniref:Titin n=1 Tax=Sinocyclocheilus anshuiensis TaxID=1608454 RepID=A0A671KGQ5_9TELE
MPIIDGGSKITNYIIEKRESTRKAYAAVITQCEPCSIGVSDLAEGLEYYFRVSAENEYGIGEAVETPDPIRVSQAPTPPENVTFTDVTKHTVRLAWTKPKHDGGSRVTGYVIEAQKKGTDQWAHVTTVKSLDFTVKNLNENEEYIFRVMAVNNSGRSCPRVSKPVVIKEQSSEPEFDLRGVCQKIVIAKAGEDIKVEVPVSGRPKPTVSWQKDNQALKLTQRTMIENTSTSTILIINECLRSDSGIYSMTGKNIVGSVTDSITVKVHDLPGPPKGPIKLDKISRTFIEFSWEAPENDGGVPINNYIVEIRETTSQTWVELSSLIIRTTFKATRLTTGIEYQFRVKAKNRYGTGPPLMSEAVVAAYPFKVPGPPGTPKVVTFTKDTMTIGWNEPVSDGGSEVIGYHVERKERNSIVWHRISKALVIGNLFKSTGLEDGVAYEFRVIAENIAGTGKPSKASEPMLALDPDSVRRDGGKFILTATNVGGFAKHVFNVKVLDRPGPPRGPLTVSDITAEKCVLTWNPPADDGGANIEHYVIEKRESSRLAWTNVASELQVNQYQVTKLLKGNEYIFRVMAVNKYGVGEPLESEAIIAENPYVRPDPPQTPEITAVTKDSVVLCWGAPASNGGSEITNYRIEKRDRISLRWVKCNKRNVTDLHFKVTALVPGHEYEFRVFAENAAGISESSPSSPFVKATDALFKPGPPGNPRVLDTTSSSITLAWNKPVYDGGSEITGYILETCLPGTEEDEWTIVSPKDGVKGTSFTITNLKENQEYKMNVSAVNSEGIGEAAPVPGSPKAEERLIPPEADLDAELRKIVNIRACNTLRLFVPIRGRPTPEAKWSRENDEPLDRATIETTSSFTSLVIANVNRFDSGKYNLTVENSSGTKTVSVIVRVLDTPGAPQNLKISQVTKESVSLVWDPPLNDGGTKIKNYIVEKREATRKAYATVNANCHKTTYTDVTKTSVTLSWEKPEHDGGSRVVAYVVEMQSKGNEKWTQAVIVKVPEAVITGLAPGEEYMFRVSARNEKGTSDPRQIGVPVIAKDLVFAPSAKMLFSTFSVLAGEDLTVDIPYNARPKATISWLKETVPLKRTTRVNFSSTDTQLNLVIKEACRDDVGQYSIKLSNTRNSIRWMKLNKSIIQDTTFKTTGLEEGMEYEFRVYAENIVGIGKASKISEGYTARDPCDPPGTPEAVRITKNSIAIAWTKPEYDGGSKVTGYIVEKKELPAGQDEKYEFRVIARNAAGVFSDPSYSTGPIVAKDEIEPPRISIDPEYTQTIVVNAGDNFKIDADIHGKPTPSICWMKGEQELGNTISHEIKSADSYTCLTVKEAKLADGGQYTLLLKNPGGEKTVQVNICVL